MEFITGFFAGWLFTWPALLALIILGILFEHNEGHKTAIFVGLISAVASYFYFGMTLSQVLVYLVGYLVIGLLWSFCRYKRQCNSVVKAADEMNWDVDRRRSAVRNLQPSNMIEELTTWVLVWPFSVIGCVAGDVITLVQSLIKQFFRGVYNRIHDVASKALLNGK